MQSYMTCSPNGNESDLLGYWNFEEGSGSTAADQTNNGNNGTLNGANWSTDVPAMNVVNNSISWSTGDTTSSINVLPSQNTTYVVTVADGIGSCTDSMTTKIFSTPTHT